MENRRFDAIAKSVAQPASRRKLFRFLGGGGAAALGGTLAATRLEAQSAPCQLAFVGTVRVGPSANQLLAGDTTPGELKGQLTFTGDDKGAIGQGQLVLGDGTAVPLVGQIQGRAINLRLTAGPQQVIVAVGTADQDLIACTGPVDGLLTGPQLGDLGDWHGSLSAASQATASAPPGGAGGNGGNGQAAPASSNPMMTPTSSTATATAPATSTVSATQTPGGDHKCNICGGGDPDCPPPPPDGTSCGGSSICCSGACIDPSSDSANCGACGHACTTSLASCIGGVCKAQVLPTLVVVACSSGQTECGGVCVNTSVDPNNCGSCGHACPASWICVDGICSRCPIGQHLCGDTCTSAKVCP